MGTMASRPPGGLTDRTAPTSVGGAAQVAGWGLGFWGAVQLAGVLLERRPMALALVQAALAEWGAGRAGVAWSDPLGPIPSVPAVAKRAGVGAAWGAGAALAAIAVAAVTHGAAVGFGEPGPASLAVGLGAAMLAAVRDELLLRGVVLRATRGLLPGWAALVACGAAAAAARLGIDGAFSVAMAAEALRAVALAGLWMRDRGAWMAWGANTAWTWTLDSVARGGALDVRFAAEPDSLGGTLAVLALAVAFATTSIGRRSPSAGLR
jgi:hypothetical protein